MLGAVASEGRGEHSRGVSEQRQNLSLPAKMMRITAKCTEGLQF